MLKRVLVDKLSCYKRNIFHRGNLINPLGPLSLLNLRNQHLLYLNGKKIDHQINKKSNHYLKKIDKLMEISLIYLSIKRLS